MPAFQFYPGDWLKDNVAGCSLSAQGLWLRMMIVMHNSDQYGCLSILGSPMPPAHVAQRCGIPLADYETLMTELDLAGVPSRQKDGTIFSRRMVRDAKAREIGRKFGRLGGSPPITPPPTHPPTPSPNPPLKRKGKIEDSSERIGSGKGENGQAAPETRAESITKMAALRKKTGGEK